MVKKIFMWILIVLILLIVSYYAGKPKDGTGNMLLALVFSILSLLSLIFGCIIILREVLFKKKNNSNLLAFSLAVNFTVAVTLIINIKEASSTMPIITLMLNLCCGYCLSYLVFKYYKKVLPGSKQD